MKDFNKPPFKQNSIAIGFTLGVHVIAIVGLLYLGMSKAPEPPKQIKTVLIKPEDLTREVTEFEETAHTNLKEEITQTAEPSVNAPVIPTAPPVDTQKAKQELQKAEEKAAADAKLKAANDAKAKAAADAKAKAENDAKAKAAADAKAKAANDAKAKAAADAKAKAANDAKAKAAADAKAKAANDAKAKAAADAKAKAANDAKAKAAADAKAKAANDAKAKAAADAKAKAANDAKAKAAADAKAKADADAKAKAAADAKAKVDADAKASAAKKAAEEAATKKAEAKRIASSAIKEFTDRITRAWIRPSNSAGEKASARVTLSNGGAVLSVVVNASDPDMKASIEAAVRSAAPYPMPSDPDARREARSFTSNFTSK
ncbi:cell envelope integrity protein TolA [Acinetobacter faecalis]|uniref:cell envelope integrity protein TolA n=1 Tax=Acinetobacter faecalis TaxID=2665161 RepID=UPI002A91FC93|nr:cell envelope integrity protein TolA [Acinetobacter faecalis]MDY6482022.1 cell envelope integrity protein TolA [Acinetobacter faecalis]